MSDYRIEIKDVGIFDVKWDYLHRGKNPRIVTTDKGLYKSVQFNMYEWYDWNKFQNGYDYEGNEIQIKLYFEPQVNRGRQHQ